MSEPVIDVFVDARLEALTTLLEESLVARFGPSIVRSTHNWPIPLGMISASSQFPALLVYRESGRQEAGSAFEDDIELATFRLRYYLPPTPIDRAPRRWPALHAVWKHCIGRIRFGQDPASDVHLGEKCFNLPGRAEAIMRYALAPESESRWVPMFDAAVTVRSSDDFEIDFPVDDLLRLHTTAMLADDEHPDGEEPLAFESLAGDPPPASEP